MPCKWCVEIELELEFAWFILSIHSLLRCVCCELFFTAWQINSLFIYDDDDPISRPSTHIMLSELIKNVMKCAPLDRMRALIEPLIPSCECVRIAQHVRTAREEWSVRRNHGEGGAAACKHWNHISSNSNKLKRFIDISTRQNLCFRHFIWQHNRIKERQAGSWDILFVIKRELNHRVGFGGSQKKEREK